MDERDVTRHPPWRPILPPRPGHDMTAIPTLAIELGTDTAQLSGVFEQLESFAASNAWPEGIAMQVQLILEEVLINSMTHGLGGRADGRVTLSIRQESALIDIEVTDNGIPFDPLDHPEPDLDASIEDRRIGGLGIHFMRTIMDEVGYQRDGDLNRLRMRKRLAAGP